MIALLIWTPYLIGCIYLSYRIQKELKGVLNENNN